MNSTVPEGIKAAKAYIPIANKVTEKLSEKMNGIPLSFLSEAMFNAVSAAHIPGGCCMGASPEKGVL